MARRTNRRGNLHWTSEGFEAIHATVEAVKERLAVELARCGASEQVKRIAHSAALSAFSVARDRGQMQPMESKTPLQQHHERKAKVISIRK